MTTDQMSEHTMPIDPSFNPVGQVHYWIALGIRARTNMTEDEARQFAENLIERYLDEVYARIR